MDFQAAVIAILWFFGLAFTLYWAICLIAMPIFVYKMQRDLRDMLAELRAVRTETGKLLDNIEVR